MNSYRGPPDIRGKPIGIFFLSGIQFLVGGIHVFFGIWLLSATVALPPLQQGPQIYNIYTATFGVLVILFTYGIWKGTTWSWIGTVGISLLVLLVDTLAMLELPTIPGIPKFAGVAEIFYSLVVLICLSQKQVRAKYGI